MIQCVCGSKVATDSASSAFQARVFRDFERSGQQILQSGGILAGDATCCEAKDLP